MCESIAATYPVLFFRGLVSERSYYNQFIRQINLLFAYFLVNTEKYPLLRFGDKKTEKIPLGIFSSMTPSTG
ncbi:hypothetical protein [Vibrio sp. TRT 2004]|uniref:hypothetical protein n=1 Tax=Vibrio sp. TRT 2004 TaxID=3418506 RepID=UPI003CEC55B8